MRRSQVPQANEVVNVFDDTLDSAEREDAARSRPWQVLIVDDEADVHRATAFALEGLLVQGHGLAFLHAYSEREARPILEGNEDIAVVLLDVVMEAEDSGLRLVRFVRDDLRRQAVRIVLHTGQPGYAPEMEVIRDYDINDYRTKSELTRSRLAVTVIAAIRSFEQIRAVESGRRNLEKVVTGAADLFARRGMANFRDAVLTHSCRLFGDGAEGFVCAPHHAEFDRERPAGLEVVAATGSFRRFLGHPLRAANLPLAMAALQETQAARSNCHGPGFATLYLRDTSNAFVVVFIRTGAAQATPDTRLIDLFCANASVAFENVRLFERLRTHAYTDQLTGLHNRTRFVSLVDERIVAGPDSWVVGIIDIDQFSEINDAFGHAYGDLLLKAVARRLGRSLRSDVVLARVAGDSFGLLGPQDAIDPEDLLGLFGTPHKSGPYLLQVSASIGLVRLSETHGSGLDAVKDASIGLDRAKSRRQGSYCYFTHAMEAETKERVKLALGLRRSLRTKRLQLFYQPQIELATGRVVGAEALLRWRNRDGTFVPPHKFIPVAESSGLIRPIGAWVLRTAARQLQAWCNRWSGEFRMAVNVSVDQFRMPGFSDSVRGVIEEFNVDPRRLELEITESIVLDEMEIVLSTLRQLKDLGVTIAIDDFGTGYSSLGYLQRLHVDRLKIDRSFVKGLGESGWTSGDRTEREFSGIPEMIVKLGHSLDLKVVAEGVETEAQARLLRSVGCEEAQGYLYCRPVAADDFERWVDRRGLSGSSGTG